MSQWLTTGLESLSSITNQLSELTHEVLREGVEEVKAPEDEVVELKREVANLQDTIENLNSQVDTLKQCNLTLREKNEVLELQLLRSTATGQQGSSQTSVSGNGNGNGWTEIDEEGSFMAPSEPLDDPSPVYSLSFKCSKLEDEVKTLKAECSHWKSLAIANNQESTKRSFEPSTSEQTCQTVPADDDRMGGHPYHGALHLLGQDRNKDGSECSSVTSITDVAIGKLDHVREFLNSELDNKSNISQQLLNTREENIELKRILAKLNSLTSESAEISTSADDPDVLLTEEGREKEEIIASAEQSMAGVNSQAALAERRVKNLIQQNASLKDALEELDQQNQTAIQQIITTRDKALCDLKSVTKQLAELKIEHYSATTNCTKAEAQLLELKKQIENLRSVIPETIADDKMSLADCAKGDFHWHGRLIELAKHSIIEMMEEKQAKSTDLTEMERRHHEEVQQLTESRNSAAEHVELLSKQIEDLRQRELESAVTTDVYLTSFSAGDDQNGSSTNAETYNAECQTEFGSNESFELMNDSGSASNLAVGLIRHDSASPSPQSLTAETIVIGGNSASVAVEELNHRNAELQRQVDHLTESFDQSSCAIALLRQKSMDAEDLHDKLAEQLSSTLEELGLRNASIDQLQAKIDDLTRENEDYRKSLEDSVIKTNLLTENTKDSSKDWDRKLEESDLLKSQIDELTEANAKLSETVTMLTSAKELAVAELNEMESKVQSSQSENALLLNQLNDKTQELESQRNLLSLENAEREKSVMIELENHRKLNDKLTVDLKGLTESIKEKAIQLQAAAEKIDSLEKQLNLLNEMRDSASSEGEQELFSMKSELQQKTEESYQASQKLDYLNRENDNLKVELDAKSMELAECSQKLSALETEIANLNHQVEQLAASKSEATSLADEKNQLVTLVGQKHEESVRYHQELMRVTEAYNALMQQQSSSLQQTGEEAKLLANKLQAAEGEIAQLKSELGTKDTSALSLQSQLSQLRGKLDFLESERNSLSDVNEALKVELDMIKNEMRSAGTNESKSSTELMRLRQHLLQVEETYTAEAVKTEDRERQLRERVEHLEDQLLSCTTSADGSRSQLEDRLMDLETELETIAKQRDNALLELSSLQDKHDKTAKSLHDLQSVLQHFQQERDTSVFAEVERYKRQLNALREENSVLLQKGDELEHQLEESQEQLKTHSHISEQLAAKDAQVKTVSEKVNMYEEEISGLHRKIAIAQQIQDGKIDKDVIKNLFIGYLCSPGDKKPEVAHLLGCVLGFGDEDFKKTTGASASTGWLSFLGGGRGNAVTSAEHESLTRAFVNFLEKESTPKPEAQPLPVDSYPTGSSSGYHLPSGSSQHYSSSAQNYGGNLIGGGSSRDREGRVSIGSSRSSTPHYLHGSTSMIGGGGGEGGGEHQRHDPLSLPTDLNLPTFKSVASAAGSGPSLDSGSGGGLLLSSNDFVKQALQS